MVRHRTLHVIVSTFLFAVALTICTSGCSTPSFNAGDPLEAAPTEMGATEDYAYSDIVVEEEDEDVGMRTKTASNTSAAGASEDSNKVVIKSAYVSLRTRDYDTALDAIRKIIDDAGGNVTSSSESGGRARSITIETRVDPNKLDETVEKLRVVEGCTIQSANVTSDDVTRTYNDTENRIEILNEQYEHYKKMLEEATTTEDMLNISDHMYDVMAEIKSYTDMRDDMKHDADLSRLSVSLEEEVSAGESSESPSGNFAVDAWEDSWGIFGTLLRWAVYALIILLPYLLIGGTVFAIVLVVQRRKRARRQAAPDDAGADDKGADNKGEVESHTPKPPA